MKLYAFEHNEQYPVGTTEQAVKALVEAGTNSATNQPVEPLLEEWPNDEWDSPLQYEYPSEKPIHQTGKPSIWSVGPDQIDETDDDMKNWGGLDLFEN